MISSCNGCQYTGLDTVNNRDCAKSDTNSQKLSSTNLIDSVSSITDKNQCIYFCLAQPDCTWASFSTSWSPKCYLTKQPQTENQGCKSDSNGQSFRNENGGVGCRVSFYTSTNKSGTAKVYYKDQSTIGPTSESIDLGTSCIKQRWNIRAYENQNFQGNFIDITADRNNLWSWKDKIESVRICMIFSQLKLKM